MNKGKYGRILLNAVLFSLLLLLSTFAAQEVFAADNLVVNGGFKDENNDGTPDGWGCSEGNWSGDIRWEKSGSYSLSGVVLSRTETGDNLSVSQIVFGITPGAEYEVQAMVKSENVNNSAVCFKMEFWKNYAVSPSNGDFLGDRQGAFMANTNGAWKTMTQRFTVPVGCERVVLMLRLYGAGTVRYDNVTCMQVAPPPQTTLTTDEVFYYSDIEGTGTASVEKTEFYDLGAGEKTVAFSLLNPSGQSIRTETVPFSVETGASFSYSLTDITEEKTAYTVRAELQQSGETVRTMTQNIYRYPRPEGLGSDGRFREADGTVFRPCMAYHCREKDLAAAADAGVTLVQGYWGSVTPEEYLDLAEENGIKVMVALYSNLKPPSHPESRAYAVDLINTLKDHPALYGWMIMDEPYYNLYKPELLLEESYKMVRDLDDRHPVYLLESESDHYKDSAKYADILGIDPYIGDGALVNTVSSAVKRAVAAMDGKKPVYAILQTFKYTNGVYFPSDTDVQHMIYQASFAGAKGVGYYCFENANNGVDLVDTELWQGMLQFKNNVLKDAFSFLVDRDADRFIADNTEGDVRYSVWERDGKIGAIAINQTSTEKTIEIDAPGALVERIYGAGSAEVTGDKLRMTIEASGALAVNQGENPLPQPPVTAEGLDGGFEALEQGVPNGYLLRGGTWDNVLRTPEKAEYSPSPQGGQYIAVSAEDTVEGVITGLLPETTYNLSLYVKSHEDGAAAVTVTGMHTDAGKNEPVRLLRYAAENGITYHEDLRFHRTYGATDTYKSTDGTWRKITFTFTLPEGGNALKISLGNKLGGTVSFDGITVGRAENLIPNGDFEGLALQSAEGAGNWCIIGGESFAIVQADNYGEPASAETEGGMPTGQMLNCIRNGTDCKMSVYVPVVCGETYRLSIDYANVSASSSPYVWIYYTEGAETRFVMAELHRTTNKWHRYEAYIKIDTGTPGRMTEIRLELLELAGRGNVGWDNISLAPCGVRYYNGYQRIGEGINQGDDITVQIDFVPKAAGEKVMAMYALYSVVDGKKALENLVIEKMVSDTEAAACLEKTITVPESDIPCTYEIRGFLWRQTDMAPLWSSLGCRTFTE